MIFQRWKREAEPALRCHYCRRPLPDCTGTIIHHPSGDICTRCAYQLMGVKGTDTDPEAGPNG